MELLPNRDNPPGLLRTYIVHRDDRQVVINEEWDISVPGCPLIRNPWFFGPFAPTDNQRTWQKTLTPEQFEEIYGGAMQNTPNARPSHSI